MKITNRRDFLRKTALGVTAGLLGVSSARAAKSKRPNIVLFIADDVSVNDFGCYGHPTIQTPNVDRLADQGNRFENAYLPTASCSPCRTSLITGRYPHNTGGPELHMFGNPHLKELPQFPHELQKAGYYTALAGKGHFNGYVKNSFNRLYESGVGGAGYWVTALKDRPKDQPFFMWFAAKDAHRGWDMPLSEGPHGPEGVQVPPYLVDGEATRTDLAHYYNEVHRFDKHIGDVIDELKAQKIYENTVIVVMADNGRPFPRDKTWLFDSGIKTPLVVHWPAEIQDKKVSQSLVSSIDIAPTLLEMAGVATPKTFQGVSFLPLLKDPAKTVRDVVFAERNWHAMRYHERMVRHGNFVYIKNNMPEHIGFNLTHYGMNQPAYLELVEEWKKGTLNEHQKFALQKPCPPELLFDVKKDPHQLTNLAEDPAYEDQLNFLRNLLKQWTEATGDTVPTFEEMTPDVNSRETWKPLIRELRPKDGVVPGYATKAWTINKPGPIRVNG